MNVYEAILSRKSIRSYDTKEIENEKLGKILEAGRLAPSWQNKQCWQYVVVKDKTTIGKLALRSGLISKSNFFIKDAPVVIVACANPNDSGHLNGQDYYLVDGGVVNPVPVDVAEKMGADIIIAISLAKISPYTTVLIINKETGGLEEVEKSSILQQKIAQVKSTFEGPNIFEVIVQSIDIMEAKITDQSLEGADIVIVPFGIKDINLFDFDKAESVIKGGIMATLLKMPEIKKAIKEKLK